MTPMVARYKTALAALPSRLRQSGLRLLERISTANWLLEWNLPRWLGEGLDLSPVMTGELIMGNVYGLAFVRIQDDLSDGESDDERETTILLGRELYNRWIERYHPMFDRQSVFWEYLDRFNGQWLRSTLEIGGPNGFELRSGQAGALRWLAERGAPLKICCVAACLLADRETLLPRLLEGVDHLLAGAVLVDHADDWQADLAEGRYNAFAAFISPQAGKEQNRQAVLEELYLGSAAQPYFALAQEQFRRALLYVQGAGIRGLEAYLAWAVSETAAYGGRIAEEARQRLRMAAVGLMQSVEGTHQA